MTPNQPSGNSIDIVAALFQVLVSIAGAVDVFMRGFGVLALITVVLVWRWIRKGGRW